MRREIKLENAVVMRRDPYTFNAMMVKELRPDLYRKVILRDMDLGDAVGVIKRQLKRGNR